MTLDNLDWEFFKAESLRIAKGENDSAKWGRLKIYRVKSPTQDIIRIDIPIEEIL